MISSDTEALDYHHWGNGAAGSSPVCGGLNIQAAAGSSAFETNAICRLPLETGGGINSGTEGDGVAGRSEGIDSISAGANTLGTITSREGRREKIGSVGTGWNRE